jgi:hypothetical protein
MIFLNFFRGGGAVVSLCLFARVLEDSALGPALESSVDSPLRVWAEIEMAEIRISPSKLGIGEMKLSKAYTQKIQGITNQ